MSYVEVFKVEANGDVISYGEARNNHAGAPAIWSDLAKRYGFSNSPYVIGDLEGLKRMWKSIGTGKLERWEEVLLACTFDNVWVPPELVVEAGEAFKRWYSEHGTRREPHPITGETVISHLCATTEQIGDMMLKISGEDPKAGVAFNMCSANSPYWHVYDSQEALDEGIAESRPYNILTDKEQPCGYYKGQAAESIAEILAEGTADS